MNTSKDRQVEDLIEDFEIKFKSDSDYYSGEEELIDNDEDNSRHVESFL